MFKIKYFCIGLFVFFAPVIFCMEQPEGLDIKGMKKIEMWHDVTSFAGKFVVYQTNNRCFGAKYGYSLTSDNSLKYGYISKMSNIHEHGLMGEGYKEGYGLSQLMKKNEKSSGYRAISKQTTDKDLSHIFNDSKHNDCEYFLYMRAATVQEINHMWEAINIDDAKLAIHDQDLETCSQNISKTLIKSLFEESVKQLGSDLISHPRPLLRLCFDHFERTRAPIMSDTVTIEDICKRKVPTELAIAILKQLPENVVRAHAEILIKSLSSSVLEFRLKKTIMKLYPIRSQVEKYGGIFMDILSNPIVDRQTKNLIIDRLIVTEKISECEKFKNWHHQKDIFFWNFKDLGDNDFNEGIAILLRYNPWKEESFINKMLNCRIQ